MNKYLMIIMVIGLISGGCLNKINRERESVRSKKTKVHPVIKQYQEERGKNEVYKVAEESIKENEKEENVPIGEEKKKPIESWWSWE